MHRRRVGQRGDPFLHIGPADRERLVTTMRLVGILCLVVLLALVHAKEPPTQLRIGVKSRPAQCDVKTRDGQELLM